MSNKSEVCRLCLGAPLTGDGLRLRVREADDIANDGTLRSGDFVDGAFTSGNPSDI